MTDRRRRGGRAGGVLLVGLLAGTVLAGCSSNSAASDDPYLAALRSDPMSSYAVDRGELVHTGEQGRKDPSSTSKGQQARVLRSFALPSEQAVQQEMAAAVTAAEQAGWSVQSRSEQGAVLSRTGPDGRRLSLTVATSVSEPTELAVTLTAG